MYTYTFFKADHELHFRKSVDHELQFRTSVIHELHFRKSVELPFCCESRGKQPSILSRSGDQLNISVFRFIKSGHWKENAPCFLLRLRNEGQLGPSVRPSAHQRDRTGQRRQLIQRNGDGRKLPTLEKTDTITPSDDPLRTLRE